MSEASWVEPLNYVAFRVLLFALVFDFPTPYSRALTCGGLKSHVEYFPLVRDLCYIQLHTIVTRFIKDLLNHTLFRIKQTETYIDVYIE